MSMVSPRNREVFNQTTAVRDAMAKLDELDCIVTDIRIGQHQPVILIESSERATALPGAIYMRERVRGQLVATWVARICRCQVRWTDPLPAKLESVGVPA
jgi:hypothetical protein